EQERRRGGGEHRVWGRVDENDGQRALIRLWRDVHGRIVKGRYRWRVAGDSTARKGDAGFKGVKPREMPRLDATAGARGVRHRSGSRTGISAMPVKANRPARRSSSEAALFSKSETRSGVPPATLRSVRRTPRTRASSSVGYCSSPPARGRRFRGASGPIS